jgi:hypothetical protein
VFLLQSLAMRFVAPFCGHHTSALSDHPSRSVRCNTVRAPSGEQNNDFNLYSPVFFDSRQQIRNLM